MRSCGKMAGKRKESPISSLSYNVLARRFQLTSDKSYNKVLHSHQIINKFSSHQLNTYNFRDEVRNCLGHRVRASGGSSTSDKGERGHPDLEKGGAGGGVSKKYFSALLASVWL